MDKFRAIYGQTPLQTRSRNAADVARWQAVCGVPFDTLTTERRQAVSR